MTSRSPWILLLLFGPVPFLIVLSSTVGSAHQRIMFSAWGAYGLLFVGCVIYIDRIDRRFRLRKHRADFGLCLECGYNLRGIAGRCPECGASIPVA